MLPSAPEVLDLTVRPGLPVLVRVLVPESLGLSFRRKDAFKGIAVGEGVSLSCTGKILTSCLF